MARRPPGSAGGSPADRFDDCHRGWHSRRYLPHFDEGGLVQMVTYRLADALPDEVIREHATIDDGAEARRHLERNLDGGYGSCVLRRPEIAAIVVGNWKHFHSVRYELVAWVCRIMCTCCSRSFLAFPFLASSIVGSHSPQRRLRSASAVAARFGRPTIGIASYAMRRISKQRLSTFTRIRCLPGSQWNLKIGRGAVRGQRASRPRSQGARR